MHIVILEKDPGAPPLEMWDEVTCVPRTDEFIMLIRNDVNLMYRVFSVTYGDAGKEVLVVVESVKRDDEVTH